MTVTTRRLDFENKLMNWWWQVCSNQCQRGFMCGQDWNTRSVHLHASFPTEDSSSWHSSVSRYLCETGFFFCHIFSRSVSAVLVLLCLYILTWVYCKITKTFVTYMVSSTVWSECGVWFKVLLKPDNWLYIYLQSDIWSYTPFFVMQVVINKIKNTYVLDLLLLCSSKQ